MHAGRTAEGRLAVTCVALRTHLQAWSQADNVEVTMACAKHSAAEVLLVDIPIDHYRCSSPAAGCVSYGKPAGEPAPEVCKHCPGPFKKTTTEHEVRVCAACGGPA
jgi:hypothetical protein